MVTSIQQPISQTARLCYEAALYYACIEGIPVFPLNGKVPFAGSQGFYDATTDADTITHWWKQWPHANIGIPTGKRSGWIVLDIDARHGGFASFKRLLEAARSQTAHTQQSGRNARPIRTAYTGGGGRHLVFATRNDLDFPIKNATELGGYAGIDLRGDGGYIVAAPSLHESGKRYAWLNYERPIPFPDFLVQLCRPHPTTFTHDAESSIGNNNPTGNGGWVGSPQKIRTPRDYLEIALRKAQVGSRHRYALFLACRLVGDVGLSIAQAEPYMREYARRVPHNDHAYEESEAVRCLMWAYEHA